MNAEERNTYKRGWARANRERLAELRRDPAKIAQKREYDRVRYQSKRGEYIARATAQYEQDRPAAIARAAVFAASNPDKVREYKRSWKLAHPDLARRVPAAGRATTSQIAARVEYYGGRCAYCSGPYEHLDHVIPLSRGGTGWPANLRPSCAKCNLKKHAKLPEPIARLRAAKP